MKFKLLKYIILTMVLSSLSVTTVWAEEVEPTSSPDSETVEPEATIDPFAVDSDEGEFIGDVDKNNAYFSNNYLDNEGNAIVSEEVVAFVEYDSEGNEVNHDEAVSPKGLSIINTYGEPSWSRAVSTQISVYAKRDTIPDVTLNIDYYNGTKYHYLVVDASNTTFVQLDYAGSSPKTLNNFVDSELTNSDYWFVGSINAGFFTNSGEWPGYGYPTGAVRTHGAWQYWYGNGVTMETIPDHNSGYVTAYWTERDLELSYNGWDRSLYNEWGQPGNWYGSIGRYNDYENAVSGSYTLFVNGEETNLSPGYSSATSKFAGLGRSITIFGQLADGRYVLLTTEGTCYDQTDLLRHVGQIEGSAMEDALRMDGGGSTQMCFDQGLIKVNITDDAVAAHKAESQDAESNGEIAKN